MTIITNYLVVHGQIEDDVFASMVQRRIDVGWQPYGGPFFTRNPNGQIVGHQTVVLHATSPEQLSQSTRST